MWDYLVVAVVILVIAVFATAAIMMWRRGSFIKITDGMWGDVSTGKNNPKLEGSGLIDAIPQTGNCPNNCEGCFYNGDGWFRTKETPLLPSLEEVGDKVVRVNSGHDSNIHKTTVLLATDKYKEKFYNTSIPNFDFPAPVVFTCNGRYTDRGALVAVENIDNLMMVRFRTNSWNLDLLAPVYDHYFWENDIPITLTFMRYDSIDMIPMVHKYRYEHKKSILNEYWIMKREEKKRILEMYQIEGYPDAAGMCGTLDSSYCRDCGRCIWSFNDWKKRHQEQNHD